MPANFVPEDGTGLANANSLVDVAYADQYFLDRANATWAGAVTNDKQTALVRATDYVTTRFRFRGGPFTATQALPFPQISCVDGTVLPIPDKLLRAVCEYAVRALSAVLAPDPTVDDTGAKVQKKTETVGPITEETEYVAGAAIYVFRPYPSADILLRDLLVSSGGGLLRN
jgi:hypothetical protein